MSRELLEFSTSHPRLLVLTGAGCSSASGIPAYRDEQGAWRTRAPVPFAQFARSDSVRRRYWARSLVGWTRVRDARPNLAHQALARLEALGRVSCLVTQNVDGLHQRAGSREVVDLHGRLDRVRCLDCGDALLRSDMQALLDAWNPGHAAVAAETAPDGDAFVEHDFEGFRVPDCPGCGGRLKPDVVMFGENVPTPRVAAALLALERADALLCVGSSLMVYSGFRFCLAARALGKPVAALNLGRTRADALLMLKVEDDCGRALHALADAVQPAVM
jgi:NAD-dependent SIR2 family protein deacetylase